MRTGTPKCTGEHDFFIADTAQVGTTTGKVVVIALCKLCGELVTHEVVVA